MFKILGAQILYYNLLLLPLGRFVNLFTWLRLWRLSECPSTPFREIPKDKQGLCIVDRCSVVVLPSTPFREILKLSLSESLGYKLVASLLLPLGRF